MEATIGGTVSHERCHPAVTLDREGTTVVFRNVPARVCGNCGEEFVDEATTESLLRRVEAAAKAGVEVEVRGFAA